MTHPADIYKWNPYGVTVGSTWRSWDSRDRDKADDEITSFRVINVLDPGDTAPFGVAQIKRFHLDGTTTAGSIRLDNFKPSRYRRTG